MRSWLVIGLVFSLIVLPSYAYAEEIIQTVDPSKPYHCVYINLPKDMGLSEINRETEVIIETDKSQSPWTDMTYNKVVIEPKMLVKTPVCFYYNGKNEGDFTFYNIRLHSPGISKTKVVSGGLCVSKHTDVDMIDASQITNKTDICELLNENADIFDLRFKEDITYAKPDERLTKTLYIISYANVKIKVDLITSIPNDFESDTFFLSPSHPVAKKTFRIRAPNKKGEFKIIAKAVIQDCSLPACKKTATTILNVSEYSQRGLTLSVIPQNINIKQKGNVTFKLVLKNYDEPDNIHVNALSTIKIAPTEATIHLNTGEEKTVNFEVEIPSSEANVYEIEFKARGKEKEMIKTAYVSVGEILSDAKREAETIASLSGPDIKEEIERARKTFESRYKSAEYGKELNDYENLKTVLDDAKKSLSETETKESQSKQNAQPVLNWLFLIPVILIIICAILFFIYKKSKVVDQTYDYSYGTNT